MDTDQENTGQPLPPKVDLKKKATPSESTPPAPSDADIKGRFQTMQINLPDLEPAAPPSGGGATVTLRPSSPTTAARPVAMKRETSRIPLEAAKAPAGSGGGPTTIRIKPAVSKATVELKPIPGAEGGGAASDSDANKRKTSRISLESAMVSQQQGAESETEGDGPRTIRLKRPVEPITRSQRPVTDAPAAAAEGEGSESATRKKTVKLRRMGAPEGSAEEASKMEVARAPELESPRADSIHWIFGVLAVAAMLVAAVAVYVCLSQLTGGNLCLTQLSVFWPGADLPWINKIPLAQ
jgi:hypothetical protein